MWNVRGLGNTLVDEDFLNTINDYDFLLFTETWFSKKSYVNIKGYSVFNCPRPKCNKRAKRNSGGIAIYYRDCYVDKIQLVKSDNRGIIWVKLLKQYFGFDKDVYLCLCYIPPENSGLYKKQQSELYSVDMYSMFNDDVLIYRDLGDIFIMGDFNTRVGEKQECID